MDYKAEAEKAYEALVRTIESDDWGKEIKSSKDHKVYRKKSEHFNGSAYKCVYTVDLPLEDLIVMSLPKCLGGHIEDIDSLVKEMECLEEVSDDVKVVRTVTTSMAMGLISSRELIDLVYIKRFPDNDKKAAVVVKGVDHDLPVAPKLVRGKHFVTGLIMEVVKLGDKDVLEIKHIEELDFSGNVPSKVIESFIPSELMGRGSTLKKNHKKLEKIRAK